MRWILAVLLTLISTSAYADDVHYLFCARGNTIDFAYDTDTRTGTASVTNWKGAEISKGSFQIVSRAVATDAAGIQAIVHALGLSQTIATAPLVRAESIQVVTAGTQMRYSFLLTNYKTLHYIAGTMHALDALVGPCGL